MKLRIYGRRFTVIQNGRVDRLPALDVVDLPALERSAPDASQHPLLLQPPPAPRIRRRAGVRRGARG
jgi:hypothetical protein